MKQADTMQILVTDVNMIKEVTVDVSFWRWLKFKLGILKYIK